MNNEEINKAVEPAKELPAEVLDRINELSEAGNDAIDEDDFDAAVSAWEEALELVPAPQEYYVESVFLNASIGDAYFLQDNFDTALAYFLAAKSNVAENAFFSPFLMLRLGQCYLELEDEAEAKAFLLRAYTLDAKDIFEDEDEKYFTFLSSNADLKA